MGLNRDWDSSGTVVGFAKSWLWIVKNIHLTFSTSFIVQNYLKRKPYNIVSLSIIASKANFRLHGLTVKYYWPTKLTNHSARTNRDNKSHYCLEIDLRGGHCQRILCPLWSFCMPQESTQLKYFETGPTVFYSYLRRLERLLNRKKGSTLSTLVISRATAL